MDWFKAFAIWSWLASTASDIAGWLTSSIETVSTWTGDIMWAIASSPPALVILGAVAIAAFLIAHVPLIERWFPSVIPFTRTALLAQYAASIALIFLLGFSTAHERDQAEKVRNDLAWAEWQIGLKEASEKTAYELMAEAKQRAEKAEGELSEYKTKFGEHPSDPPPGVLEWLRQRQQHPERRAGARPDQGRRGIINRVRATGADRQ